MLTKLRTMVVGALPILCATGYAREISICADPDPSPWTYWARDSQLAKTSMIVGSSVDTSQSAFSRLGHRVKSIGDLPWAPCLATVQEGKIDFAMDAYFSADRARLFDSSHHYNTLTPQVFYRAEKPVVVSHVAALKKYQGCGMIGATYAHYGLKEEELDLDNNTYEAVLSKLKVGRCDYFVEELEVIGACKKLGRDLLADPDLRHNPVSDASPPAKHLIAAKAGFASRLLPQLNETLDSMNRSGELSKIWKKHMPGGRFKP